MENFEEDATVFPPLFPEIQAACAQPTEEDLRNNVETVQDALDQIIERSNLMSMSLADVMLSQNILEEKMDRIIKILTNFTFKTPGGYVVKLELPPCEHFPHLVSQANELALLRTDMSRICIHMAALKRQVDLVAKHVQLSKS